MRTAFDLIRHGDREIGIADVAAAIGCGQQHVVAETEITGRWSDLEVGHSAFVHWCLTGDFEALYAIVQAPAARQVLDGELPAWHEAMHCHPPLWTVEGQSGEVSTRAVPALELVGLHAQLSQVVLDF